MLAKKLVGEKCYLSPYEPEYSDLFYEWLNDLEVIFTLTLINKTISHFTEKENMLRLCKEHNYLIVDNKSDKIIGGCGF